MVTEAVPGHRFTVERTERGGGTMRWTYTITPAGEHADTDATRSIGADEPRSTSDGQTGSAVTLSYQVLQPVPIMLHVILRLFLGCPDLEADLHRNLEISLARIDEMADGLQSTTGRSESAGTAPGDKQRPAS